MAFRILEDVSKIKWDNMFGFWNIVCSNLGFRTAIWRMSWFDIDSGVVMNVIVGVDIVVIVDEDVYVALLNVDAILPV